MNQPASCRSMFLHFLCFKPPPPPKKNRRLGTRLVALPFFFFFISPFFTHRRNNKKWRKKEALVSFRTMTSGFLLRGSRRNFFVFGTFMQENYFTGFCVQSELVRSSSLRTLWTHTHTCTHTHMYTNTDAAEVLRQNRRIFEQNVAKSMRGGYVGSIYFERCLK